MEDKPVRVTVPVLFLFLLLNGLPADAWADPPPKISNNLSGKLHLREVARGLSKIRAVALKNIRQKIDAEKEIPKDQTFKSSLGLFAVYSVDFTIDPKTGPAYQHMLSFTFPGASRPNPFTRLLLAYFHDLLRFDKYSCFGSLSRQGAKLGCILSSKKHKQLSRKSTRAPRFIGCIQQDIQQDRKKSLFKTPDFEIPPGRLCKLILRRRRKIIKKRRERF